MKIASFNINNVNKRLGNLLAWLKDSKPDVVCLQELKALTRDFPENVLEEAGYQSVWKGQKSWNGVAILARGTQPVMTRDVLPGDDSDEQSRYIEAAVNGVLIGCLYLPNGNPQPGPKFDYKLRWFERLIVHAADLRKMEVPVVLAGDYNVVPTDFDIYRIRSMKDNALVQPESRALFQRLLDAGWTDALRTLYPDDPMYSFWDYKFQAFERNHGMRLDHFLLSDNLVPRLTSAGVDRDMRAADNASDHAPVWLELS